ncbi:T9SS type A sorting domain-containing protein [Aquimarina sp. MMG016]|uniref:T9SS type A sorting domain-containing protein n=1 Tax=Aquimarina sp. MMG016 TaxID=2822690 RepID=UPI001B3A4978|nr:T9SS type A sorting domain-containing protein [Aquimarina sp. MMG016]MBQ4820658.1 T9SS type A sorting domain-containing protein [Aquimarina sp. MMG016]
MKKLFLAIIMLISSNVLLAQKVHSGNLTLTSQEKINDFSYTEITGDLIIQEGVAGSITDLSPLETLQKLGGGLYINSNKKLESLYGLSGVVTINGSLEIMGNADLNDISGLSNVQRVIGNLRIHNNHKITSLKAFNKLKTLHGGLSIHWNTGLKSLDGFTNLERTGEYLSVTANLNMTNLNGLSKLTYVGGHLRIINNRLYNLRPLAGVTSVRSLVIRKTYLNNLDDLSGLTEIRGGLYIQKNNYLNNVKGISAALSGNFVTLDFVDNPYLENIEGLENITSINVSVRFINNQRLKNLDPLSNINSVIDNLEIKNNSNLESACGIIQLLEDPNAIIKGFIAIEDNSENTSTVEKIIDTCNNCRILNSNLTLSTQSDIDNFNYCKINGNLTIEESSTGEIKNLNGLSNLTTVTGNLSVLNNSALTDLGGLSNLSALRKRLVIQNNSNLIGIGNLENLTAIGSRLTIVDNPSLVSLEGFSALKVISGHLYISNNQSLVNLDGLNSIGLDLFRYCDIHINNNQNLINIDALSGIGLVPGNVIITANPSLKTLDGLSGIQAIQDGFRIKDNTGLENACGISKLIEPSYIGGLTFPISLDRISNNGPLFPSAKEMVDSCNIIENNDVILKSQEEVDAFNYNIINGRLIIKEEIPGDITNLDALKTLKQVESVHIMNNTALEYLGGLTHNLKKVTNYEDGFVLDGNPLLFKVGDRNYDYFILHYLICKGVINQAKTRPNSDDRYTVIRDSGGVRCRETNQSRFKQRKRESSSTLKSGIGSNTDINIESQNNIILYPTVSNGNQINLSGIQNSFSYTVYDVTGKLIRESSISNVSQNHLIQFDKPLKSGMYLIMIQEIRKEPITLKFMVR